MLTKEYRIPLPMSVEEYRIAQLYMIQKKSRLDSIGEGSGVEILENYPYKDGPGGNGQYTKKIYHIGSHLPGWLKAILPKSALCVVEEAWNAYPYTKMRTTCPFVERFYVDVETKYLPDVGQQENVFDLPPAELSTREVDLIDPVKDYVPKGQYTEEEDPQLYKSKKTGRGPLKETWLEEYLSPNPHSRCMCAYKIIRVEFRYWGMQGKIERFIHDSLRSPMLMGHRQAWVWQDEWHGLTIADIRRLEKETQLLLAEKMGQFSNDLFQCDVEDDNDNENDIDIDDEICTGWLSRSNRSSVATVRERGSINGLSPRHSLNGLEYTPNLELLSKVAYDGDKEAESEGGEMDTLKHRPPSMEYFQRKRPSGHDVLKQWRMSSIATSDSGSEDEFFDAQEDVSSAGSPTDDKWYSMEFLAQEQQIPMKGYGQDYSKGSFESLDSMDNDQLWDKGNENSYKKQALCKTYSDSSYQSRCSSSPSPCKISVLLLIIHGGNVLDNGCDPHGKQNDCKMLQQAFDDVIKTHYKAAAERIAVKLVECPPVCLKALQVVKDLCPQTEYESDLGNLPTSHIPLSCNFPVSAIPLLVVSSPAYADMVNTMIAQANKVYFDFLRSEEGQGFGGEICILGDCLGALLAYDALANEGFSRPRGQSEVTDLSTSSGTSFQTGNNSPRNVRKQQLLPHQDIPNESDHNMLAEPFRRRVSSHVPPKQGSLEKSRSLRLSLSSGDIRNNINAHTDEALRNLEPECADSPKNSPRIFQKASFDSLSISLDPIFMSFDFLVSKFFAFGSPIGMVIAYRKILQGHDIQVPPQCKVNCNQFYNLFHPSDPSASRIEPMIIPQFSQICPVTVPRYLRFPLGDNTSNNLLDTISAYPDLFTNDKQVQTSECPTPIAGMSPVPTRPSLMHRNDSSLSSSSSVSSSEFSSDFSQLQDLEWALNQWWGSRRLDYALYCPEGLQQFPTAVLSPLFHTSYWESTDMVSFIVRQIVQDSCYDNNSTGMFSRKMSKFTPSKPCEKWLRKRTPLKIKNLTANHRGNDVVVLENSVQTISGRFMYGPLDMVALTREKVDIYIMTQPPSGEWVLFDSIHTNSSGRVSYDIPEERRLGQNIYPVKLVVRGDHTSVDCNLAVVPPKTEVVVFSIDGSFTASLSIRGKDPKVKAGAVDVVRYWQELGYVIIYVTSRPDFQKHRVVSWLAEHNFPFGLVSFCDGIQKDIHKHKTDFLRSLVTDSEITIQAAYGSTKDIPVYAAIGLHQHQMYVIGRHMGISKKYEKQAQVIRDGYASHLNVLMSPSGPRPAVGNSRLLLRQGCFGLPERSGRSSRDKVNKRSHSEKMRGEVISSADSDTTSMKFTTSYRNLKTRTSQKRR